MINTTQSYTVAMPWYEREDFAKLSLIGSEPGLPGAYDEWHRRAMAAINLCLSQGKALELVTVRSEEYLGWLESKKLSNTPHTRRRYIETLAGVEQEAA